MIANMPLVQCKTCDVGTLNRVKRYRMSGVVVMIGYILLIPSVLAILLCLVALWQTANLSLGNSSPSALAATGFVEATYIAVAFAFLVGGLLGWLLIMKKDILQCGHCGAVIAAS
jgi:hypothetical protein